MSVYPGVEVEIKIYQHIYLKAKAFNGNASQTISLFNSERVFSGIGIGR